MVQVAGLVQATDGAPVADARIKVARAMHVPGSSYSYGTRQVEFHGAQDFAGGEDGRFASPARVPRYDHYSVTVSAPAFMPQPGFLNR